MGVRSSIENAKVWQLGLPSPSWWIAAGGVLALFGVGVAADGSFSAWARSAPRAIVSVMAEITSAGESGWVLYPSLALSVLAGLATLLARRKLVRLVFVEQARLFAFIFVCIGLTSLVSTLAKVAIGRGRPVDIDAPGPFVFAPDLGDWADQSFPSGHATTAFALATVLSMLSLRWRWPAFGAAALVGLSRVVLGMHYPSDVLGGAALGIVGACAIRNGFAQRKLVFEGQPNGRIALRPFSALRRYLSLKRRGGARVSL